MPAAQDDAAMMDARMQCLGGLLGPVLVDEAQPHRGQQDYPDDHRVAALADEERRAGRNREQDQQRGPELPSQHRKRPRARSRRAASASVRPARSLPSLASTSGTASGPAATTPSGAADTGLASPA